MDAQQPWSMHGLDATVAGAAMDHASQDDSWSSSSRSGPTAPTTLNVEDWYVNPRLFEEPALLTSSLPGSNFSALTATSAKWQLELVYGCNIPLWDFLIAFLI
jgi:hypothetical protein